MTDDAPMKLDAIANEVDQIRHDARALRADITLWRREIMDSARTTKRICLMIAVVSLPIGAAGWAWVMA